MVSPAKSINSLTGKYRVIAELGQGGTADVSLAVASGPQGFSKLVVLKSMKALFRHEPGFVEMFMNEARLAARLEHPNIVQTNEVFDFEGLPVIVMEYLQGQTLSFILARATKVGQKLPLALHVHVLSECLSALEYSHNLRDFDDTSLDLVHRDVSPHNLVVTYDGQVKLLDFGIAKLRNSGAETATGVIKGKLRYMPPEQITGEFVDRRADLYAVGVMLWEALTGRKLWENASDANIMHAVLNQEAPRPSSFGPVDPELEKVAMRALSSDPEARFETASQMQVELEAFLTRSGDSFDAKTLGRFVTELFSEEKEEARVLAREQLARVVALSSDPPSLLSDGDRVGTLSRHGHSASGTRASRTGSRTLWALALFGGFSGLILLAVWQSRSSEEPKLNAEVAPAQVTQTDAIVVRVTAFPADAELILGGERLPTNPASRRFARSVAGRTDLVVNAPHHQSVTKILPLDQDTDIVVTLVPSENMEVKAATRPLSSATRQARPSVATTPSDAIASPSPEDESPGEADLACDPPYYIDERGVKKFKAGCL